MLQAELLSALVVGSSGLLWLGLRQLRKRQEQSSGLPGPREEEDVNGRLLVDDKENLHEQPGVAGREDCMFRTSICFAH